MDNQITNDNRLIWKDEYSVKVAEIDEQHKHLFEIINKLFAMVSSTQSKKAINDLISEIVSYKVAHFATEEKYFHQFNFEGTKEHEIAHQRFDAKVKELVATHKDDTTALAFELVDFLEDWLVGHLMSLDQQYVKCFKEHGLK